MKKKYYYDCPIQALYMNKEFGVRFYTSFKSDVLDKKLSFHVDIRDICNVLIELLGIYNPLLSDNKIYVAPESEFNFEPKEGDLGQMKAEGARFFVKYNESLKEWKEWHCGGYYSDKNGSEIIYRNGKHFFNPKEEN